MYAGAVRHLFQIGLAGRRNAHVSTWSGLSPKGCPMLQAVLNQCHDARAAQRKAMRILLVCACARGAACDKPHRTANV